MKKKVGKIAVCGLLTALSLLSFMLENLFPSILVPGARIGISNIFILLDVILVGVPYGFAALIIKCVLGSLFSGNVFAVVYSLPAGAVALTVETLLFMFIGKLSIVAISVAGAVINSVVQNATYCLVTKSVYLITYLPYLVGIGVIGGLIVGFAVYLIIKNLPKGYSGV